ncbi:hypothetical protein [Vulcanisaeta sp. JCM 14467]|uniref:hypothetical protein n=1 Tax=Vulcanisaeta sp. JCM 14467 TaxID=1295370 RepID=UPI002092DE1C|nr:hypothetical protein [Vulcanisaeta sp. JCM 14467]
MTDLVITLVIMYLYNFSVVPLLSATMDVSTLVTILMYFMIITITAIALGIRLGQLRPWHWVFTPRDYSRG